eukprot:4372533-Alexandrium_andersonii.AAC.1
MYRSQVPGPHREDKGTSANSYKHVGQVGATRFESVRRPRHYGRAGPWASPCAEASLGPLRAAPKRA